MMVESGPRDRIFKGVRENGGGNIDVGEKMGVKQGWRKRLRMGREGSQAGRRKKVGMAWVAAKEEPERSRVAASHDIAKRDEES